MNSSWFRNAMLLSLFLLSLPAASSAQHHVHATSDTAAASTAPPDSAPGHDMAGMDMSGMNMAGMDMSTLEMNGAYGPYPMSREASGTAWQPQAARHSGLHLMRGDWMLMLHGSGDLVRDHQGGPRGGDRFYGSNMVMGMAQRRLGAGTLGLRAMLSAEPATIGKAGYPLLLQSGETADGKLPLIDRQHPHDLFMELAGSYSVARGTNSLFVYAGLPGEPALGPPAFMHRFSGENLPQAPITHHWLDSSHITYGVLTAGAVLDRFKLEASTFRGREPDQNRWDLESPKLDSHSFRLSFNPTEAWALQVSHGRIQSPEQLEPSVDQDRTTASALFEGRWERGRWEGMVAWGRDLNRPGHTLDAFTAEASAEWREVHTFFARAERVQKDELFRAPDGLAGEVFEVGELSAGYRYDLWTTDHLATGIGVLGTLALIPEPLRDAYGRNPASVLVFAHVGVR